MSRTCSICSHKRRTQIEAAIASGVSNRRIATQFETSEAAIRRHTENCIKPIIQEIIAKQEEETAFTTISEMDWMREQARGIYQDIWNDKVKDHRLALQALAELRRQNELRAKLEGEIDEHSITITAIPEWRELRALLLDALRMHPQARMAVIRALEAYDHERSA